MNESMLPKVAIIGRPNVGKSSLLNSLANRRVSIVDPTAGVTRDRVSHVVELPPAEIGGNPRHCELIDTGGYGIYTGDEDLSVLTSGVEGQIIQAMDEAQIILFVIDAQIGITALDQEVARLLRQNMTRKDKVVLVANKVDHEKYAADAMEGMKLGFGEPILFSATTGLNKLGLQRMLSDRLDFTADSPPPPEPEMMLAIVGQRNAGKSTLVNALAGVERVIVSEMAGTTRDSIDVRFDMEGKSFVAIDTAGVRKRKSMADDVEYYSYHRALRAIRRADVVMLLIDATKDVSKVDKKLSLEIQEHHKPCVIVVNKWDLVQHKLKSGDYLDYLADALRGLTYSPIVFISAKDNDHVRQTVETALSLHKQAGQRISTGKLNTLLKEILDQRGPSSKLGSRAKVYYTTMAAVRPPTIVMFVNHPDMFDQQYQRYMINEMRKRTPYPEVPIKLIIRERPRRDEQSEVPQELVEEQD